ncbi:DUF2341 domain-containing protein [Candidatus Dojkabacteria bacterium]|nr:DUF2341 domain-containing protein [Candidatus Dojkabacteria bacterium]
MVLLLKALKLENVVKLPISKKVTISIICSIFFATLFLFFPKSAHAAWLSGYSYRRAITIDQTYVTGSTNLAYFPVLVSSTNTTFKYSGYFGGHVQSTTGADIHFTSSDGSTELLVEQEYYNNSTGQIVYWVSIPSLSYSTNTTIYVYYGNSSASAPTFSSSMWTNANYILVYHQEETSGNFDDSAGGTDGTPSASGITRNAAGQIDGADSFSGTSSYVDTNRHISYTNATISAWFNSTGDSTVNYLFGQQYNISSRLVGYIAADGIFNFQQYNTSALGYSLLSKGRVDDGYWHNVLISWNTSNTADLYVDGSADNSVTSSRYDNSSSGTMALASHHTYLGFYSSNLPGLTDEFRIATGTKTLYWHQTEYYNQSGSYSFYTLGSEELSNVAPTVSNVVVNSGNNITLTGGTTTSVSVTATITDGDGYGNIDAVNGVLYESGVKDAETCELSINDCYSVSGCTLSGCSGNSCTATCTFSVYYVAIPTDSVSPYPSDYWVGWVNAVDKSSASGSAFSSSGAPDVNTLRSVAVTGSVSYGSLYAGGNTGSSNSSITITNNGNSAVDLEVSGTNLCTNYPTCTGGVVPVGNQEYSLSTFTYSAGTDLSGTAALVQANLAKPTADPSNSYGNLYWGVGLPSVAPVGSYSGIIYITAVANQ